MLSLWYNIVWYIETKTCWAFVCERPCTPSLGSLLESNRRSDPAPEHQTARHLLGSRDPLQGTAGTQDYKTRKIFPNKRDSGDSGEFLFPKKNMYCQWGLRKSNIQSANASKCVWRDNTTEKVSVFNQGTVTSEFQKVLSLAMNNHHWIWESESFVWT